MAKQCIPGIRENTPRKPCQGIKVVGIQVQAPQEQDVIPTNTIFSRTHNNFMHISSMTYYTMQSGYITHVLLLHFSCCNILISYVTQQTKGTMYKYRVPHSHIQPWVHRTLRCLGGKMTSLRDHLSVAPWKKKVPSLTE